MCRKPMTVSELNSVKHCTMSMIPDKNSNCLKCSYHTDHVFSNKEVKPLKYYSERLHT